MSNPSSDPQPHSDDLLVVEARRDRAAFGALFDQYYPRVLGYCMRRLPDRARAEDATSEVFLKVAAHLREFTGSTQTDFRRWLFRIAVNTVNAQWRQTNRRDALLESAARQGQLQNNVGGHPAPDHDLIDWPAIATAISELDDREQTIVQLRFFAGLSHDEIAGVIDATSGAVRTALSRALAQLRTKLKGAGAQEHQA